jgi:hypothetical protein
MSSSRHWVFTSFHYDLDEFKEQIRALPAFRYIMFQEEMCPSTERLHLQGYIEMGRTVRESYFTRRVTAHLHLEKRRGTRTEAREYSSKERSRVRGPWEYGDWGAGGQGSRSDLESVRTWIIEHRSEPELERKLADEFFGTWVRYHKSLSRYVGLLRGRREWKTEVIILWGDAGTGKTRYVYDTHGYDEVYDVPRPNGGSVWFDGYTGQEVVLLDDFYGWIPLHLLLKLGDRYPLQVPTKGSHTEFSAKYLYITSNKPYEEWYKWADFGLSLKEAFERRIDKIEHFTNISLLLNN